MSYKHPFKNPEFEQNLNSLNKKIELYLSEKEFELKNITLEHLIQWNDVSVNGSRLIYPHENCPSEIKNIVQSFINDEFRTNE